MYRRFQMMDRKRSFRVPLKPNNTFTMLKRDVFSNQRSTMINRFDLDRSTQLRIAYQDLKLLSIKDAGNEEQLKMVNDLQSKLEVANSELISEKRKAQTLAAENEKLQYRLIHLLRSLKNADLKLEQVKAREQLENLKLQDS